MLMVQLPALQIVLPLMGAPVCALLRRSSLSWLTAFAVSAVSVAIAVLLLAEVWTAGPISYAMGGWAAPWGIEYRVDALNAGLLLLVSALATVVVVFARDSIDRELNGDRLHLFYAMFLLCLTGLMGITITADAFNLFVFLEISSLATYTLISLGRDRRALTASYQYLVMGSLGATFILIGIGLLYMMTGTLNMADLAARLPGLEGTRTIKVAFAFFTVGVSLKLALFPLHGWLPDAYAYAPSPVSAFIAATATKVAIYVLLRFFFSIFGAAFSYRIMPLGAVLLLLSLLAMFVASFVAIFQTNVKRLLAYSSVAQIGYIILGLSLGTVAGVTAGIIHILNHALIKGALFLALGSVFYRLGSVRLEAMEGLAKRMPWTMAAFVLGGLSLIGVPLTTGFVSKWYLVSAVIQRGWWPVAVLILLSSLLALVYVWRVVEVAYFGEPGEHLSTVGEAPVSLLVPTWLLVGANIYFGSHATWTWELAHRAALSLFGGGP